MKKIYVRPLTLLALPVVLACISLPLKAQWLGGDYNTYGVPQVNYAANSFLNFSVINNSMARSKQARQTRAPKAVPRAAPPLRNAPAAPKVSLLATGAPQVRRSANELAARVPAAYRQRMSGIYVQSFDVWVQLAAKLGLPRDDLAGASAAFIAGNVMAMRNEVVPDDHFKALALQLRESLAENPAIAKASPGEKRVVYEQFAMVGMFMATSQLAFQRNPDPKAEANFRQTARANLQQVLKLNPDSLKIGRYGLE